MKNKGLFLLFIYAVICCPANYTFASNNNGTINHKIINSSPEENQQPIADAGVDQYGMPDETITLDGSASFDPDGDPISYNWTSLDGIELTDANTANPTFTAPEVSTEREFFFQLEVSDGTSTSAIDEVKITITTGNHTPIANAGSDKTVNSGEIVSLDGSASLDPDGDDLTYQWTSVEPSIILSDENAMNPSFTAPTVNQSTIYYFKLVVSDSKTSSVADEVAITVNNNNQAPTANAGVDQEVERNTKVYLNGSNSSDPDGNPLTYNWVSTDGTITLTNETSVGPSFTAPNVNVTTDYYFQLIVNDGTLSSDMDEVKVTVIATNRAPTANAGTDITADENTTVTLDGSGSSDPDGDDIDYQWVSIDGITLSSNTAAKPTFTAPSVTDATNYRFQLTVNDGTITSDSDEVLITVENVNQPPVANAGQDQSVDENTTVELDGSSSTDPDGGALTYQWTAIDASISLSDATIANPTFTAPNVNETTDYKFELVVNDGSLSSEADIVNITVNPATGISEIEQEKLITISPNPSNGKFIIELNKQLLEKTHIAIYDTTSAKILEKEILLKEEIDFSNKAKGTYILKAISGEKVVTKKIILE